ncbi:MAG TPA: right-handed parallel beta-helix repeat-containing protein, partial [Myxococcota bacterium]|nr:right-handed parallel beta-helix repeat-containing protein [Myxococcota bacterium]
MPLVWLTLALADADVLVVDCIYGPYYTIQSAVDAAGEHDTIAVHACVYTEEVVLDGSYDLHIVAAEDHNGRFRIGAQGIGVGSKRRPGPVIDRTGMGTSCVRMVDAAFVTLDGLTLTGCLHGVEMTDCYDVTLTANRVEHVSGAAIIETSSVNQLQVVGNLLRDAGAGVVAATGFETIVVDNRVAFLDGPAVAIAGWDSLVVDNDIAHVAGGGVLFGEGDDLLIARNTFTDVTGGPTVAVADPTSAGVSVVGNLGVGSISDASGAAVIAENPGLAPSGGALVVDCAAGPYTTIGAAVADALEGDTIVVHPCAYPEAVLLDGIDLVNVVAAKGQGGPDDLAGAWPIGLWSATVEPAYVQGDGSGVCMLVGHSAFTRVVGLGFVGCGDGLYFQQTAYAAAIGAKVLDAQGIGLVDEGDAFLRVIGNTIDGGLYGLFQFSDAEFTNVVDNRAGRSSIDGMEVDGVFHRILHNKVVDDGASGLVVHGRFQLVARNTAVRSATAGGDANLRVASDADWTTVVGNRVRGSLLNDA